mgnify:FL=1
MIRLGSIIGFLFLAVLSIGYSHGQEPLTSEWMIGAQHPESPSIWPRPLVCDTAQSLEISGYGALQYSPGAKLRGAWLSVPSAGGVGWQLGTTWAWNSGRWSSSGMLEHWRVAGVHEDDWNEAWQWGTWDGMGWAWNPNQTDNATLRAVGSIQYQVSPSVTLEAGNHRHHWGNGWRSLWLDRQAAPLPAARIHVQTERIEYTHLIARTLHRSVGSPPDFPGSGQFSPGTYVNKRSSWLAAHAIDARIAPGWKGSLFGGVTWLANDSGYTHRFEAAYAIPVIAFRPAEYALGSADNALVGAALTYTPVWADKTLRFYGQVMLDELVVSEVFNPDQWWANKWGVLGSAAWRSSDKTWGFVLEACAVRPYTYAHAATAQSWTHNRQPLAHPAGSNFAEGRAHAQWKRERWSAHAGLVLRRQAVDERVALDKVPSFSIGADPMLSYITRPADYGIDLIWDGEGLAGETDVIDQRLVWADVGYEIRRIEGQQLFLRVMQNRSIGERIQSNWWRLEMGIRLNRVLEERNW